MKKTLFLSSFAVLSLGVSAQQLGADYVAWPQSTGLPDYITNFTNNSISENGWEDENFFVSRVKPKTHIRNVATQIYQDITAENDKRLVWWVPIGNASLKGVHTDALPNGVMDSEVFSMWSYVTHYGDWISPYGWVPAALADVAHKNGVAVSGVASIPYGSITGSTWQSTLLSMNTLDAEKVGEFLLYHGVDGLGYNSEFSGFGQTNINKLCTLHNGLVSWMKERNPIFENMWYAGTADDGMIRFDIGLGAKNYKLFKGASYFLNYNWNRASTMQSSIEYAETLGRDPLCLYAGINMQGGEPGSNNWPLLKQYRYSIGLWGAHEVNMLWQSRNSNGSSTEAMQNTYLKSTEQWFSNGNRNPAMRQEIKSYPSYTPHNDFHGMSALMSARSSLGWNLAEEPFISYFNLGNGAFFNWMGERAMTGEWYNIGVQDYLPTWRYWFAPSFLNNDVQPDEVALNANFTWDDAFFGGSCLNITGTSQKEYLHLFKTDFALSAGDVITIRYKLRAGEANARVVFSTVGNEATAIEDDAFAFLAIEDCTEAVRQAHNAGAAGWRTLQVALTEAQAAQLGEIAMIALRFDEAKNMNLLLGEFSITKATATPTPEAPIVDSSKLFVSNFYGTDGKIIFHMPGEKAKPEPTYNLDVNASMFRLYAQEEDGDVQFLGATTSWAGLAYRIQSSDDNSRRIRIGVSAVSVDMKSESAISWGEWLDKPAYSCREDFGVDKTIIKPGQEFTVGYFDPRHAPATWTIYNVDGQKVAEGTGTSFTLENGLPEVGGYDLVINEGTTQEIRINYYIQITDAKVGALPEITALSVNGEDAGSEAVTIEMANDLNLAYTGVPSNGEASRGLALQEKMVGAYNNQVGIAGKTPFSVCAWIRLDELPSATWDLFNICDRSGAWPMNNWGWCWVKAGPDGKFDLKFRNKNISSDSQEMHYSMPGARLQAKVWTHLAFIFDYGQNGEGFRAQLYINGQKQEGTWTAHRSGNSGGGRGTGGTDDYCSSQNLPIGANDMILFGGVAYQGAAANGQIDDFQIWNKALTADDVKAAMAGFAGEEIPAELIGLWSFEDEPDEDGNFFSAGSDPDIPAYHFSYEASSSGGEGQGGRKIEQPMFVGGSPFLAGTAFPVRAIPTWKDNGFGTTINGEGSDVEGSATAKFSETGDHTITLTLENFWGKDTREYPVFTVEDKSTAIGKENLAQAKAYTVDDQLFVQFPDNGRYTVSVYTASGLLQATHTADATPASLMRITLAQPGVYLVNIMKDGRTMRNIKLMRK